MAAAKSSITVGLVTIPVRLEKATDEEDSGTHTVCTGSTESPHDPSRVKMSVACTSCGVVHTSVWGFPKRGTERDGKLVVLSADDLAAAAGEPIKQLVPKFHSREKVYAATVASDSVQNIAPDKGGERAYVALRNALAANPDVVAVAVWAPRSKNALWVLEVVGERIVASKRAWPEQVRVAPAIPAAEVTEMEQGMFNQLVAGMTEDFDVAEYVDQRKIGIADLIARHAGNAVPVPAGTAPVTTGTDMLAALQATIDAMPKPAKPRAARKAPAKKTAAKKTAAKRTTTRKKVA